MKRGGKETWINQTMSLNGKRNGQTPRGRNEIGLPICWRLITG